MSPIDFLDDLQARGVVLVAVGDYLRYNPKDILSERDVALLCQWKREILNLLAVWHAPYGADLTDRHFQVVVDTDIVAFGHYRSDRRYRSSPEAPESIWERFGLRIPKRHRGNVASNRAAGSAG